MQRTLVVGLVVLLLGLAAWWLAAGAADAPTGRSATPTAEVPTAPARAADASLPDREGVAAIPRPDRVEAPAPEPSPCTLRGRCIDAGGQPLAGVHAALRGWAGNEARVAEWSRQHGEPQRVNAEVTTGADGAFEFRFWPPPPFVFALRLSGPGVATWSARWNELPAGVTHDLGDLRFERGTLLRGRVVDTDGLPVAGVEVRINAVAAERTVRGFESWCDGRTQGDGSFVCRWALVAGEYELGIDGRVIERPQRLTLAGDAEQLVQVVVRRLDPADAITGVVVDQHGAPVQGAMITPMISGRGRVTSTDREGRFRVQRPEQGAPDQVRLSAHCEGYGPGAGEAYAWGRTDVRLVLHKGQGLEVTVLRDSDGSPVEDYLLRVVPDGGGFSSSSDLRPRGGERHAGGRQAVETVRPGRHHVIVEPIGDGLAIGVVPIEVTDAGTPPVVVRLAATAPRTVRVQRADGSPVPGAKVQLVDPLGEPLSDALTVCALARWGFTTAKKALELAAATTDLRGEAALAVPADRSLGLCLPGPLHVPQLVPQVVFPADGPFVVTVAVGATLQGTIGPAAAIDEIRRLAGIGEGADPERAIWPAIYLARDQSLRPARFPEFRDRKAMRPDGSFELTGIPAGHWNVIVQCFQRGRDGGGGFLEEERAVVDLVDGQTCTLALDLSSLLPGQLEGLVFHNGAPLAATAVLLQCVVDRDESGHAQRFQQEVTTDAEGRFRVTVRGGEYRLSWTRSRTDQYWVSLTAAERPVVQAGQLTRQTFSLQSGTLRLRLLDATGAGVGNVAIELRDAGGAHRQSLPPTDATGLVQGECEVAPFTAWVLPRRLQDQQALIDFHKAHAGEDDPLTAVRMRLGDVSPRLGETVEADLRLPSGWDQ